MGLSIFIITITVSSIIIVSLFVRENKQKLSQH